MTDPTNIGASKMAQGMPDVVQRIKAGEAFTLMSNGVPIADISPRSDRNDGDGKSEVERLFNGAASRLTHLGRTLVRDGLVTVTEVREASDQRILDIRNIGPASLAAIRQITNEET